MPRSVRNIRIAVVAAAFLFSTIGHAQAAENADTKSTLSVTPSFGGYLFASSQDLHATPIYGIKLNYDIFGYFITDALGVEAAGDYFSTTTKSSGEKATGYLLRADALYSLFPRNKWTPFLVLGLGGLFIDKGSSREQDPLLNYGVGLKYLLTDYLGVRVEARYVSVFSSVTPRTNFEISSGLTYLFGKRKSKPAAPASKAVPELTENSRLSTGAPKQPEPPKPTESMEKLGVMGAAGFSPTAPVFQGAGAAKPKGELPLAFQGAKAPHEEAPVQGAQPAEQTLQKPEASAPPAAPALPPETPLQPEKQAPPQPASTNAPAPVTTPVQTSAPVEAPLQPEVKAPDTPAAPSAPAPVTSPAQVSAPAAAPLQPEAKSPAMPAAPAVTVPVTSPAQTSVPAATPLQPEAKSLATPATPTAAVPVTSPAQASAPAEAPLPPEAKSLATPAAPTAPVQVTSPAQASAPAATPLQPEVKVPSRPAAQTAPVPVEPPTPVETPAPAALPPLPADPAPKTQTAPSTRPARPLKSVVVEFAFNSYEVQPKYAKDLVMVAALMNGDPEATIEIAGHTDNIGGKRHNYLLSLRRAESVKRQLVKYGVSAKRIATRGYGFSQPTAENGSERGRQRNRRAVAVIIYLKEP